jgi:hypothetical protein
MKEAKLYSLKVWLTTIIVAPIIFGIVKNFLDPLIYNVTDIFFGLAYSVPAGLILCIPSWLLFWLLAGYLNSSKLNAILKKLYISFFSILLVVLPFALLNIHYLIESNYWPEMIPWIGSYIGVLIGCIWIFK